MPAQPARYWLYRPAQNSFLKKICPCASLAQVPNGGLFKKQRFSIEAAFGTDEVRHVDVVRGGGAVLSLRAA
jgi:hypothetical protein